MNVRNFHPAVLVAAALLALAAPARGTDLSRTLGVDPAIRTGTLENGLTYYIRQNDKPENRLELRLAVNAGSILEEDDQQGLAHFLEHMAFNGTRSFPATDLVKALEAMGARFGPDINAYTSFDETVYMLEIPTDKAGLVDTGFQILSEWAGGITLDSLQVEKERGVIMEEWRLGQGAQERLRRIHWPILFAGSRYAERLPIGKPEVIEHAPRQRIADFYHRWYRPDLMAVIAVGSVDPDTALALIRRDFSGLTMPAGAPPRPVYPVPPHAGTRASSASDPEMTVSQVSVLVQHPIRKQGTVGAYRADLVDGLVSGMLNARLAEIGESADAPFAFAGSGSGSPFRTVDLFRIFAVPKEGMAEPALSVILTEAARAREHGFTAGELERAKARYGAAMDQAYQEREKTESSDFASEYIRNFLEKEPIPGIEAEHTLVQELLPGITGEEVRTDGDSLMQEGDRGIQLSQPGKEGESPISADTLLAVAARVDASNPAPYRDRTATGDLVSPPPAPGTVVSRREVKELGVTVIDLSNGVEVWLKPTTFKNDQILFGASAPGGLSLADSTDIASASFADFLVQEAGLGRFTPSDLQKMLAGKIAGADATIGPFSSSVNGQSTPKDLETALELLYLDFTSPNPRPEAFTTAKEKVRTFVENRSARPETQFGDRVLAVNTLDNYLLRPYTLKSLDQVDPAEAMAFYKRCFADASDFRFYFVGSFEPAAIEPLLARWLGSLPSHPGTPAAIGDPHLVFPEGTIRQKVFAGMEPKSQTRITWPAVLPNDEMEMFRLRKAGDVLQIRLRDILREDLGSTYSVGVGMNAFYPYFAYGTTTVGFGSSPENADRMVKVVFDEVAKFKKDGPTEAEIETAHEQELRSVQTGLQQNEYWLSSFLTLNLLGWDPARILDREKRATSFTAKELQDTFAKYYPDDRNTVISLFPGPGGDGKGAGPR